MPNRASTFLMIAFLGSGCGRSTTQPEKRNLCEALAIAAGALNDETLKHASQEYAAADRAMQKWEQWEAKAVRPEQNGTGEYSGASQRAQMYARAGSAFCDAARVNAWQLQELAKLTNDRNIIDGLSYLEPAISPSMWAGSACWSQHATHISRSIVASAKSWTGMTVRFMLNQSRPRIAEATATRRFCCFPESALSCKACSCTAAAMPPIARRWN